MRFQGVLLVFVCLFLFIGVARASVLSDVWFFFFPVSEPAQAFGGELESKKDFVVETEPTQAFGGELESKKDFIVETTNGKQSLTSSAIDFNIQASVACEFGHCKAPFEIGLEKFVVAAKASSKTSDLIKASYSVAVSNQKIEEWKRKFRVNENQDCIEFDKDNNCLKTKTVSTIQEWFVWEETKSLSIDENSTGKYRLLFDVPVGSTGKFSFSLMLNGKEYLIDPDWYSLSFKFRKKITIKDANVDANLTNFPLLVKIDDDAQVFANTLADGNDVRFTLLDGTTLLSFEKERFAKNGATDLNAEFWVKIPTVDGSADTNIYMYYGNSGVGAADGQDKTNVWDASYKAVYHMNEAGWNGTSGEVKDSTGVNNGTATGATTTATDAKIYRSGIFDGSSDYVTTPITTEFGNFTISAWYKAISAGQYARIVDKSYYAGVWLGRDKSNANQWGGGFSEMEAPYGIFVTLTDGAWNHICMTRNGTSQLLYGTGIQGNSKTTTSNTMDTTALTISANNAVGCFAGLIDEVRISNMARSAEWIKFEYWNMKSPNNDLVFGGQEGFVDVNVLYPENNESFAAGASIDINLSVLSFDANAVGMLFDINYSTSQTEGTGTVIINDGNVATTAGLRCDSNNLGTPQNCKYTWNTTGVAANNYYILAKVISSNNSDFNAGQNTFTITSGATTYDFTLSYPNTCTTGKGATSGTQCSRIWCETTDTLPPINELNVVPNGQSSGISLINFHVTGTAGIVDINLSLETALPTGLDINVTDVNDPDVYPLTLTTTPTWAFASVADLNLWWWCNFRNYDVANGLDNTGIIDINAGVAQG